MATKDKSTGSHSRLSNSLILVPWYGGTALYLAIELAAVRNISGLFFLCFFLNQTTSQGTYSRSSKLLGSTNELLSAVLVINLE